MATIVKPTPGTHVSSGMSANAVNVNNGLYPLSDTTRWQFNLTGAESSGNAGSDLRLQAIADDGTTIVATPLTFTRSTGALALAGIPAFSTSSAVSAAGTTRTDATALVSAINYITTAAASTGVVLPASVIGTEIVVVNAGAQTVAIYAAGSDTIDGTAGATGTTLTTAHRGATFYCVAANKWVSALFGAVCS